MKQNYNSLKYWETLIAENKTIRGHIFMGKPPKEESIYFHSLIYSKRNGIDNTYAYFPDDKALIGYIKYSFLQEAFYKWTYGKNSVITKIPNWRVDKIIKDGLSTNRITKEEAVKMHENYTEISRMWELPRDKLIPEFINFSGEFNKTWFGNSNDFLYLKVFKKPEELGEFVINSILATNDEYDFEKKVGVKISEWREICKNATKNWNAGEKFRKIIKKKLTEII